MANKETFNPDELAKELASAIALDRWRQRLSKDSATAKWTNLFNVVEPGLEVQAIATRLFHATSGSIAPDFLYAMVLAAWSYGFAACAQGLASEEFMLFQDHPLDFPDAEPPTEEGDWEGWLDVHDTPEREGPSEPNAA